jgi:hypothetical protein
MHRAVNLKPSTTGQMSCVSWWHFPVYHFQAVCMFLTWRSGLIQWLVKWDVQRHCNPWQLNSKAPFTCWCLSYKIKIAISLLFYHPVSWITAQAGSVVTILHIHRNSCLQTRFLSCNAQHDVVQSILWQGTNHKEHTTFQTFPFSHRVSCPCVNTWQNHNITITFTKKLKAG